MKKNKQLAFRLTEQECKKFKLILAFKELSLQSFLEQAVKEFIATEGLTLNKKLKEAL